MLNELNQHRLLHGAKASVVMESNTERRSLGRGHLGALGVAGAASALVVGGLLYAAAVFLPDSQPTGW